MKIRIEHRPADATTSKLHPMYIQEWYVVEDSKRAPCLARFAREDQAKSYAFAIERYLQNTQA